MDDPGIGVRFTEVLQIRDRAWDNSASHSDDTGALSEGGKAA
jgi:hypothetical protein